MFEGFWLQTDGWTNIGDPRVAFAAEINFLTEEADLCFGFELFIDGFKPKSA